MEHARPDGSETTAPEIIKTDNFSAAAPPELAVVTCPYCGATYRTRIQWNATGKPTDRTTLECQECRRAIAFER